MVVVVVVVVVDLHSLLARLMRVRVSGVDKVPLSHTICLQQHSFKLVDSSARGCCGNTSSSKCEFTPS